VAQQYLKTLLENVQLNICNNDAKGLPFSSTSSAPELAATAMLTRGQTVPIPPIAASDDVRCCRGSLRGGGEGWVGGPSLPHIMLDKLSQSSSRCRVPHRSYRDALLGGIVSAVVQDASDVIDLSRRLRCHHHRRKHRGSALSLPPTLESIASFDEGCQVVRPHQC
jgi:hypothetical protein